MLARTVTSSLLGATFIILVVIEWPVILCSVGRLWIVSDTLEPADAAIVLGGGENIRPWAAAQLYRHGLAGQILVSNGGVSRGSDGETHNLDREALIKLGVPAKAIQEFGDKPSNTYEEARALAHWARQNQTRRVIVPTEIFPTRRVGWILRHELGPDRSSRHDRAVGTGRL